MSRSRKKHPVVKDYSRGGTRKSKQLASRVVRRYPHTIADGSSYRKLYESWNICDWKFSTYWMGDNEGYWEKKFKRKQNTISDKTNCLLMITDKPI